MEQQIIEDFVAERIDPRGVFLLSTYNTTGRTDGIIPNQNAKVPAKTS